MPDIGIPDPRLNRRRFLQAGAAAAGGLLLSVALPPLGRTARAAGDETPLTAWLRIAPDDTITVMIPSAEMGQGVATSLPMLIAEELKADWRKVRIALAPADPAYANPMFHAQATGGSTSIRAFFVPLRQAGAAAREMLRRAAAERWSVPVRACTVADGRVVHPDGRSESFGALAQAAARLPVPQDVPLRARADWRIIGRPTPRLDTPAKTDGSAVFGIDVRLPDMLVGTIAACPVFGGTLRAVDEAPALAVRGVKAVVKLPDAVAVVGDGYWPAKKGLMALKPEWDEGPNAGRDSAAIAAALRQGFDEPAAVAEAEGDAAAAMARADKTVEAVYTLPFLAHATMEPMNATARVTAEGCELWVPTQAPGLVQQAAAQALGLEPERVRVNVTYLGGGFGRKSETDFPLQAVKVAQAVGRPVKLIWAREEDIQHDFYRPVSAARRRAGLDAEGRVVAWDFKVVAPSILTRRSPQRVKDGIDRTSVEGLVGSSYAPPDRRIEYLLRDVGVPVGFWRSVGNSITSFYVEGFMDELAHAAGQDPFAFRQRQLAGKPRHLAVLEKAAAMAGWDSPPAQGRFRGIAMHESFGSIVAQVVEISIDGDGLRVHRVDCAVDCGVAVNPDTIVAQMESGIVYGLTAALFGEITIRDGRVEQGNFDTYPMLRLAQMPVINVAIIEGDDKPGGIGEPGTPPIGPALANAVFAATGKRLRSLPIVKQGLTIA
ncbi:MAG: xanthine dehydrogenase family protein molybdopterin-binding subunit [Rhodospirillaceae bacterium]|nr:xanthine dehydrogenase family protein molybdopterin-binding subunit [Rhodospirillaceae bacterium]